MDITKNEVMDQLIDKFLLLYTDTDALIITNRKGQIIRAEDRHNALGKKIANLADYFKMTMRDLIYDKTFQKYGLGYIDTINFRIFHTSINKNLILSVFLGPNASFDMITPYALFLAEKIAQIDRAEKSEEIEIAMPSYQFETNMFEKYKSQMKAMGFSTGGLFRFKFVITGDGAVGKTSLVRRFVENKFDKDYKSTIGLNIVSHTFKLVDNEVTCSLWDVGGQKHFERFRQTYYLGAQAAFIIFDVTNRESFDNVEHWYNEIKTHGNKPNIVITLVGNKADVKKRDVSSEEGQKLADKLSEMDDSLIAYIETSALNGYNVDEAFKTISYQYIIKTKDLEEKELQNELYELITTILKDKSPLTIAFFAEGIFGSPGMKILTSISKLGQFQLAKDEENEKIYEYNNGLILKTYPLEYRELSDCDGVYCIFDAFDKKNIEPEWRDLLVKLIQSIGEETIILAGIRVSDDEIYSQLIKEFNIEEELEENLLYFKLGDEVQLDIYEQLKSMFNHIIYAE